MKMSAMFFGWRLPPILLLATLLAACATGPVEQAPSLPPAPASVAGNYRLSDIGGHALPLVVKGDNGCDTAIDSGRLSLRGGEFDLTRTSSRSCGGVVMARTVERSRGAYGGTAAALILVARSGQLFQRAQARVEESTLLLRPSAGTQGTAAGPWTFERAR